MNPNTEKLRKKYMNNPPEGMTSEDIRRMRGDDLLDMDYFLNEDDPFEDDFGEENKANKDLPHSLCSSINNAGLIWISMSGIILFYSNSYCAFCSTSTFHFKRNNSRPISQCFYFSCFFVYTDCFAF
jgi:hypothetical protein